MKNVYKIAFLYKFFERTLHRAIYRTIYKNIYIYRLVIFITRCTNYLPPHEEDIYGLNYLKLKSLIFFYQFLMKINMPLPAL